MLDDMRFSRATFISHRNQAHGQAVRQPSWSSAMTGPIYITAPFLNGDRPPSPGKQIPWHVAAFTVLSCVGILLLTSLSSLCNETL